jgi:signal peptidase II
MTDEAMTNEAMTNDQWTNDQRVDDRRTDDRGGKAFRHRRWFFLAATLTFVADQASKEWVRMAIPKGSSVPIVPGTIFLTHTENPGAAFGLFPNATTLLIVTALIACALFLWMGRQGFNRRLFALACGMMLGGAAGNLLDRLRFGAVTDFLDLRVWPVFNLADTALTLGALLLLWGSWRGEEFCASPVRKEATLPLERQTQKSFGGGGDASAETDDR